MQLLPSTARYLPSTSAATFLGSVLLYGSKGWYRRCRTAKCSAIVLLSFDSFQLNYYKQTRHKYFLSSLMIFRIKLFQALLVLYWINLSYKMQTTQTPFQQLQRLDKQRKKAILSNIEKKDLRRRSISYNFKRQDSQQQQNGLAEDKNQEKQQTSHITINNTIKKSFYYRKVLNKSIDTHLTSEDFQRVKQKFDKIKKMEANNDNKSSYFRELWEKEIQLKETADVAQDEGNLLEIVSKNPEKEKTQYLETDFVIKKKEEPKPKNILEIAEERRTTLSFDLEILGNKKSIRIKDNRHRLKINTATNLKTINGEQKDEEDRETSFEKNLKQLKAQTISPDEVPKKAICSFFKRFQQQNSIEEPKLTTGNEFLQIKKLAHNIVPLSSTNFDSNKLKYLKMRQHQSELQMDETIVVKRQIQSSWKPHPKLSIQRPKKMQSSQERRAAIVKEKRLQLPAFTNDIKGWMVGQQNDEEFLHHFQS